MLSELSFPAQPKGRLKTSDGKNNIQCNNLNGSAHFNPEFADFICCSELTYRVKVNLYEEF